MWGDSVVYAIVLFCRSSLPAMQIRCSYADKVQLARSNGIRQHPDPTVMDTIRGLGKVGVAVGALTLLVWSVKEALS